MKRPSSSTPGIRAALKAGIAALALASGATWIATGSKAGGQDAPIVIAQATAPATAPAAGQASPFDASQTTAIRQIIKDYLLEHPEVMLEVQSALEAKMEKIQAEKLKIALSANAAEIYRSTKAPIAGNAQGDVPVVEFFDYNCGYCKRAFTDIAKLVDQDKKIKLILKELPILSKGSEEASRVALAAGLQGQYWAAHKALISIRGEVNEQSSLRAIAKIPGLDVERLKTDMKSEAVGAEIKRVKELAQKMGIQGTPHFLVGDRAIAGAPTDLLNQIEAHAESLRKDGGCKVC